MQQHAVQKDVHRRGTSLVTGKRRAAPKQELCNNCGSLPSSSSEFCELCMYPAKSVIEPSATPKRLYFPRQVDVPLPPALSKPSLEDSSIVDMTVIEQRLIERLQVLCQRTPLLSWSTRPEKFSQEGIYAIFECRDDLKELLFVGNGVIHEQLESHFYGNSGGLITRYLGSFLRLEERNRRFFVTWLEDDITDFAYMSASVWRRCFWQALGKCPILNSTLELWK